MNRIEKLSILFEQKEDATLIFQDKEFKLFTDAGFSKAMKEVEMRKHLKKLNAVSDELPKGKQSNIDSMLKFAKTAPAQQIDLTIGK